MFRILQVAVREYISTAMTKGFIIGAFVVPAIFVAVMPLIVWLMFQSKPPKVEGGVAILDRSGAVVERVREELSTDKLAERRAEEIERSEQLTSGMTSVFGGSTQAPTAKAIMEQALGEVPEFELQTLDPDVDLDAEKEILKTPYSKGMTDERLAIIVVDPDAVVKAEDAEAYGGYELVLRPKMDDRVIDQIKRGLRRAILDARYAEHGYERSEIQALLNVNAGTKEMTEKGEQESTAELQQFIPLVFMLLLVMSVMIGGQYLLTTTVEEKASRVVEVLLSAVSPIQLMTGKIIGQMGVGATLLVIYSGVGVAALLLFAQQYLDYLQLVYLLVFFVLAYFMIASLLAAVGSAVNDMREAQSLQTPVIMFVILPYLLWMPISRDPDSTLATVLSFIPPISPFVMMMRVTSTNAPAWPEVLASIAVSAVGAYLCVWLAAKIFRVGLLMYGKPPNFRTLIKWVRMA